MVEPQDTTGLNLRWGFRVSFCVAMPPPAGTVRNSDRLLLEALAEAFGLTLDAYSRQFGSGRERFRITSIEPHRPSIPVSAERISDRQGIKFTSNQVALLLQMGMRDVTPSEQ